MPPVSAEATSPASSNGDAQSSNLSSDQAAAQLFASSQRQVAAPSPAAEEIAPETEEVTETTPESAAVEPEAETVETSTEETDEAEEAAPEPEEEENEALSQKTLDERAKAKAEIQKRINKAVAKEKEALRRAEAAERRIQELETAQTTPPAPLAPASDLPPEVAKLNDLASINAYRQQAIQAKRFAERALEAEADGDPLPEGFDRKQLREIKQNAMMTLEDFLPQREGFVKAKVQATQAAHKEFPFLTDKSAPEYAMVQEARRSTPWLQNLPNAEYIIGLQVLGYKAHQAQKAEAAKPAAPAPKPKIVAKPSSDQTAVSSTGTSARVLPATANRQKQDAEDKKFSDRGGVTASEAAAFLLRKSQNRNAR